MLESKFLSCIRRNEDVTRFVTFFKKKFDEIDNEFHANHTEQGFFMVPIHRMFTYFFTRVLMRHYIIRKLDGVPEGETPAPRFCAYLCSEGIVESP